jgi:selenocysteine lyase/cysteine desulfurase
MGETVRIEAGARGAAFAELERAVHAALETYSNVHRGSGHFSRVSTRLYEEARESVLAHFGLPARGHAVVFCTPRRAAMVEAQLGPGACRSLSSRELGLPLGVTALVADRERLRAAVPVETGGGTARLVGPGWVVWARAPDRFEAGTPAVICVIAFAKALRLLREHGAEAFRTPAAAPLTAAEILHHDALQAWSGQPLLARLRDSCIGRGVAVPTAAGVTPFVNLDNAASTPALAPVWEAFCQAWRQPRAVQEALVREVRAICAGALGAPLTDHEVVFTSNTTEALNLVAASLRNESAQGLAPVVIDTLLEHNSNELPWRTCPGVALMRMPVDAEGFLDVRELDALLDAQGAHGRDGARRVRLVAVSGASNVLGACNDLAELGRVAHRHGARLLVDAAQLVAHRKVDLAASGIDYLAFSAHKAYAPFGSGALVVRKGLLSFSAAEREQIRASGEENVAGIAALGKALALLQRVGLDVIQQEEQALTARALRGLAQVPGVIVHGTKDPESPRFARRGGVIAFDVRRMTPGRVVRELAERGGIGARSGCHCAHLLIKRLVGVPPFLERFQRLLVTLFPRLELPGVARVSLGLGSGTEDVDALLRALGAISRRAELEGGSAKEVRRRIAGFVEARVREVYGTPAR